MEVNWMHSEQLANELPAFLEAQGEGATVLLADDDLGRTRIEFFPPGKASPLCDDKSFVFVVSMIFRPGSCRFFHELEHTFFPPQSPLNREFSVLHSYWSGMLWMGCRIPVGRLECEIGRAHV